MKHELKSSPPYFQAVLDGDKTFEIRRDDRGFQKGDIVKLREFDSNRGIGNPDRYTGREIKKKISYVTAYEQQPGFVVFGLLDHA